MGAISGCSRCFIFIVINLAICFVLGIFISWINVRTVKSGASFYVQKFYVPALNSTAGGNYTADNTTSVNFAFNFRNTQEHMGIYYDDLNVTFYYGLNKSFEIGSYEMDGFYQDAQDNTYSGDSVEIRGVPWNTIVRNGSTVDFRVDLGTKVRYNQMFFTGKRRQVRVRAIVEVNDTTGLKIKKKSIRLKSGATEIGRSTYISLGLISLAVLYLILT